MENGEVIFRLTEAQMKYLVIPFNESVTFFILIPKGYSKNQAFSGK